MTTLSATLPAIAANGTASATVLGVYEPTNFQGDTVTAVQLTAPAGFTTVTGAATNNPTFAVRQVRAGTVVQTFASLTLTAGNNLVAEQSISVPITAQPLLQAGDVVDVQMSQNGTGIAVGAGLVAQLYVS